MVYFSQKRSENFTNWNNFKNLFYLYHQRQEVVKSLVLRYLKSVEKRKASTCVAEELGREENGLVRLCKPLSATFRNVKEEKSHEEQVYRG